MRQPRIFMYGGQGSQYFNMGRVLYDSDAAFRHYMNVCDRLARANAGFSVLDAMFQAPGGDRAFEQLRYTHPALLFVQYSLTQALREQGIEPDVLLGYSLGESIAAAVAGMLSLEDAVEFVMRTAATIERHARRANMMAVIASVDEVAAVAADELRHVWVACENHDRHFVTAGECGDIERLRDVLRAHGMLVQVLPVHYGFHCPLMDPLEGVLRELMGMFAFGRGKVQVVSCTSMHTSRLDDEHLWAVYREPVRFSRTIRQLEFEHESPVFIDLSPTGTLAGFVRALSPAATAVAAMSPFNNRATFQRCLESVRFPKPRDFTKGFAQT